MQSRQESATQYRNRATGYSDADWGALEKRLSDTRDLLRDILSHLRRVLDNLKTAGSHYQSTGRAWRKADSAADGYRRQWGHRQEGPAAGARNAQGTTGSSRFQSSASQSKTSSGAAGSSAGSSARQTTFTGSSKAAGQSATGGAYKSTFDRQAGAGFSWSSRPKTGASASSAGSSGAGTSAGAGAGKGTGTGAGTGSSQQRATWTGAQGASGARGTKPGSSGTGSTGSAGGSAWNAGASGAAGAGRTGDAGSKERARQAGAQNERQEHRHRTTGPGGGSSYQDYKQRSHKSPLGHGRMTLTQACALLSITYPCSADDIRAAYRKQARRHHPDLGGDEEMMKSINQAYELALSWCSPLRGKTTATWAA